jgi:probable HAF family extracellular repeat protein
LGGTFSRAEFINNRGDIVGLSETVDGDFHGFIYTDEMMYDLETLGGSYSFAFGINERGEIVGESDTAEGDTHAFVIRGGVMIDLDSQVIH